MLQLWDYHLLHLEQREHPFPPSPLALHYELVNCTVTLVCGKQQVAYCVNVTAHSDKQVGAKVSSIPEEQIYTTISPAIL